MAKYKEQLRYMIEHGFAKPNRFNVIIELPDSMFGTPEEEEEQSKLSGFFKKGAQLVRQILGKTSLTRSISLSAEQTELPGKTISTSDIKYNGDYYKMPYGQVYAVQPFTFRVSRDMYEKVIIDAWMKGIYNSDTHHIGYHDDFTAKITIEQLDSNENVMESIILYDAFPITLNSLVLSEADNNSIHRMQVQFAYRKWVKAEDEANKKGLYGSLSQTPLGPFVAPVLSNPAVQRGIEVLEANTGINLEGEGVEVYNQVDAIVRNTTGASVGESAKLLNKVKVDTQNNDKVTTQNKNDITGVIDSILSKW